MHQSINSTADEQSPLLSSSSHNTSQNTEQDSSSLAANQGWRYILYNPAQNISPIIEETSDSITLRRPLQYNSIVNRLPGSLSSHQSSSALSDQTSAALSRYKYYGKLQPCRDSGLLMPNHIVPSEYFTIIPLKSSDKKQSSLVTIFSIWNTMLGTSILSIPWAVQEAGFATSFVLLVFIAFLTLYTAYRVVDSTKYLPPEFSLVEFSNICGFFLGKWGEIIALVFSTITLAGVIIVYWILMTNFLYNIILYAYESLHHNFNNTAPSISHNTSDPVLCPSNNSQSNSTNHNKNYSLYSFDNSKNSSESRLFDHVWNESLTVPFFLILLIFPLVNFKSPTFFTKFNSLGTISVLYVIIFVILKTIKWNFHLNFSSNSSSKIELFNWNFPALTGILSLAFFIHNCIISIVKNQEKPENNGRDLSIAFTLVALSYLLVGFLFYSSFPLPKSCIEDNLLNNFSTSDVMALTARCFLLFQMITVFPLLIYILRVQILQFIFKNVYPGLKHIIILNILVISFALTFAVLYPKIGSIIRFSGAICGAVYIFTLPSCVYLAICYEQNTLNYLKIAVHVIIIAIGLGNVVGQILISVF